MTDVGPNQRLSPARGVMGLSYNPRLAKEYDLAIDDMRIIRLAGRSMTARGELKTERDAVDILNASRRAPATSR